MNEDIKIVYDNSNEEMSCCPTRLNYSPKIIGDLRQTTLTGNVGNMDAVLLLSLCERNYDAVNDIKKINFYKRASAQLAAITILPVVNACCACKTYFDYACTDYPDEYIEARQPEFTQHAGQVCSGPIRHTLGLAETILCWPIIKGYIAAQDNNMQSEENILPVDPNIQPVAPRIRMDNTDIQTVQQTAASVGKSAG